MEFITKIWNYIFGSSESGNKTIPAQNSVGNVSIMPKAKPVQKSGEIPVYREISDEEIQLQQNRSKYITEVKNPDYKVKNGDNLEKIAKKHNISIYSLLMANNLNEKSVLKIGQVLKIPSTRSLNKIKNLNDVSNALGVNKDFILKLKRNEDSEHLPDNKFHNVPYLDSNGVKTIGIGHAVKSGEKQNLTNVEVCQLVVKDMLNAEDALKYKLGASVYNKLPVNMKEALLDMVFNKGISIIDKSEGLAYCLKTGKYEAAINKMTYNRSEKTNKEMSGLSKRRLFDISIAIGIYKNGQVPQSNINTAQQVYNRGVELLREECRIKGLKFENQIAGFNQDVQKYFENKIKLRYIMQ